MKSSQFFITNSLLAMAFLIVPMTSFAAPSFSGSGSGTSQDPYIITTCDQLEEITGHNTEDFKLDGPGGIIDCTATSGWNEGDGFEPIANNFSGDFNGNSNTITGLTIHRGSTNNIGLFASISSGANIHDVTLANEDIIGSADVGGLVGYAENGITVTNVTTSGSVSGYNGVGGIIGSQDAENFDSPKMVVTLSGLHSTATVHADDYVAGGLIGYIYGEAHNNAIDISLSNSSHTGGLVDAFGEAGGVVGEAEVYNYSSQLATNTFSGLSSEGEVNTATSGSAGGIFGYFYLETQDTAKMTTNVTDTSHTTGTVHSANDNAGGIFGYLEAESLGSQTMTLNVSDVHATADVSGQNYVGGLAGYFTLYAENNGTIAGSFVDSSASNGTVTGNYEIGGIIGESDIENYGTRNLEMNFSGLTSDINVNGSDEYVGGLVGYYYTYADNNGPVMVTLGDSSQTGTVYGGSDSVGGIIGESDIENYSSQESVVSFTGLHSTGTVDSNSGSVGGIIGYLYEDNENDGKMTVLVSNSYHNTGAVNGYYDVGGIIGEVDINNYSSQEVKNTFTGLQSNAVVASNDYDNDIGGIIGYLYESTENDGAITTVLSDSYHNTGTVTGYEYVGGIIGYSEFYNYGTQLLKNTFTGLHSNSTVSSDDEDNYIGGLFGYMYAYSDNDALSEITISDSYHETGDVSGWYGVGGLIGELYTENYSSQPLTINLSGLHANNTVTSSNDCIGGLIGCFYPYNYNDGSTTVSFTDSYQSGDVTGWYRVGGIMGLYEADNYGSAGDITTTFSGLHSNANVTANEGYYAGGLIGELYPYNDGNGGTLHTTMTNSYHETGAINSATGDAGGLIGSVRVDNEGSDITSTIFSKLYNTGNVTSHDTYGYTGGLFGYLWNEMESDNTPITVSDVYYAGGTVSGGTPVGGIAGWINMTDVNRAYASGTVTSISSTPDEPELGAGGVGGLIGETYQGTGTISNSFSTANVTTTDGDTHIAGFIGNYVAPDVTLDNNYYYQNGQSNCGLDSDMNSNNTVGQCQVITKSNYFVNNKTNAPLNNWNFNSLWYTHTDGLPTFVAQALETHVKSSGTQTSSGGGGGGGSNVTKTPAPVVVPVVTPTAPMAPSHSFTKALKLGSSNPDVQWLQQLLNKDSATQVAASGPGSVGQETKKFGPKTLKAVKLFQTKHGLAPVDGIVGPKTFAKLVEFSK